MLSMFPRMKHVHRHRNSASICALIEVDPELPLNRFVTGIAILHSLIVIRLTFRSGGLAEPSSLGSARTIRMPRNE